VLLSGIGFVSLNGTCWEGFGRLLGLSPCGPKGQKWRLKAKSGVRFLGRGLMRSKPPPHQLEHLGTPPLTFPIYATGDN